MKLSETPAWKVLQEHKIKISNLHSFNLFQEDPIRFEQFSLKFKSLLFDFSKNRITQRTLDLLLILSSERRVEEYRDSMFKGRKINKTENQAALHTELRGGANGIHSEKIQKALLKIEAFVSAITSGRKVGATGEKFTDIINIGIGGSSLGPQMAITALKAFHQKGIRPHFVSNIDGHHLLETLEKLEASTSLFIIASKTFSTKETITNAESARSWVINKLGKHSVSKHFVAISEDTINPIKFGISPTSIFPIWEWVGGRYSLWSSIGLSIALTIGMDNFRSLLKGGNEMDIHFRTAPMAQNLPIVLALIGIWNINFQNLKSLAILPYDQRLEKFPAYLQQLDMESNGKSISLNKEDIDIMTAPIVFGEPGTNGQHAFYQSLHQSPEAIPADFIIISNPAHSMKTHHDQLLANALAQTKALMQGQTLEEAKGNINFKLSGNRPSNTILIKTLDPISLGRLIALYEHKIFVQGIIWGINSFDQCGVEFGKQIASNLEKNMRLPELSLSLDSSTIGLMKQIRKWQN